MCELRVVGKDKLPYAGDVIYTNEDLNAVGQYFWEAFPAGSGPSDRTTYLFTYIDADPRRRAAGSGAWGCCNQGSFCSRLQALSILLTQPQKTLLITCSSSNFAVLTATSGQ